MRHSLSTYLKASVPTFLRRKSPVFTVKQGLEQLPLPNLTVVTPLITETNIEKIISDYQLWLGGKKYSRSTIEEYPQRIRVFFRLAGMPQLEDVTEELVLSTFEAEEWKGVTRVNRLFAIKSFFRYAVAQGYAQSSPVKDTRIEGFHRTTRLAIIPEVDLQKLLDFKDSTDKQNMDVGTRETQAQIATKLIIATGIRHSELRKLTVGSLDTTHRAGEITIKIDGKGARQRVAYVSTKSPLGAQLFALKSKSSNPQDRLFYKLPASTFGRDIKKVTVAKLGTPLSPHHLRHYFARILSHKKVSISSISTLMGHSCIRTTNLYLDRRADTAITEFRLAEGAA